MYIYQTSKVQYKDHLYLEYSIITIDQFSYTMYVEDIIVGVFSFIRLENLLVFP